MTQQQKIAAVVIGAIVFWYAMRQPDRRRDETPTVPHDAPDFVAVFESNPDHAEAAGHANRLGQMCWEISSVLEYDWNKGKSDQRLTTDEKIRDLRIQVRDYLEQGGSYSELYPKLGPAIKSYFDAKVGNEETPLSDKRKSDWVSAFRGISAALLHAADRL